MVLLVIVISNAPIIGSVIGIGPIMHFLGSIGIGKFYRYLAVLLFKRCTRASHVFKTVLDGATCLATGEEESMVTHRRSVTPGKRNTKAFILVQFDR